MFLAGMATFALLYTTQPLLPLLSREFHVSPAQSSLTVSLSTIGLGLAMLVAAPVSERFGRTTMMHVSLWGSSVVCAMAAFAPSWPALLGLRLLLGVVLAGCLLAGFLAQLWDWRAAQLGMGGLGILCAAAVFALLPRSRRFIPAPPGLGEALRSTRSILGDPALLMLFGISLTAMGAQVGIYNTIGFRLEEAPYSLPVALASLVFLVYLFGSAASTLAGRWSARVGRRTVAPWAAAVMLVGVLLSLAPPLWLVVVALAVSTAGFFALHGVASGWVPVRARLGRGGAAQASSLYLFAYYLGSSVFGTAAGTAWSVAGWAPVVALCGGLVVVALGLTLLLRRTPSLDVDGAPGPGPRTTG